MKSLFIFFQHIVPQHALSRCVGWLAATKRVGLKNFLIKRFIAQYQVNMQEALHSDAEDYTCFNDFFTRPLKPGSRIIDDSEDSIICPADGAISACGSIQDGKIFQAKGKSFSLENLLGGDSDRAKPFKGGQFTTVYLSPKDYHRVHMPFSGTLKEMIFVPGKLFSVNQTTAENIPELFARNERVVCIFDTDIGPMALVLVGAMIVASIETVWAGQIAPTKQTLYSTIYSDHQPPININKGEEVGSFKLGSTAIVLFGADVMQWSDDLKASQPVQMGQAFGQLKI